MRPWILVASIAFCAGGSALAAPVTLTRIAATANIAAGTPITSNFLDTPGVNDSGVVAFAVPNQRVIFTYTAGVLGPATTPTTTAQFPGNASINNAGQIANSVESSAPQSLRIQAGGTSTPVATTVDEFSDINAAGQIAYTTPEILAFGSNNRSLLLSDGVTSATIVDVANPEFSLLGAGVALNDQGRIAFGSNTASATLTPGLYVYDGSAISKLLSADTSPFATFGVVDMNNAGDIVFRADQVSGGNAPGLFVTNGAQTSFVSEIVANSFVDASINDKGSILISRAETANAEGQPLTTSLSFFRNGVLETLFRTGDVLDGLVIANISVGSDSLNENDEFAFWVLFEGGGQAIYFASLTPAEVPLPGAAWLFVAGLSGLAMRLRARSLERPDIN